MGVFVGILYSQRGREFGLMRVRARACERYTIPTDPYIAANHMDVNVSRRPVRACAAAAWARAAEYNSAASAETSAFLRVSGAVSRPCCRVARFAIDPTPHE
jgi:hypothetical protein